MHDEANIYYSRPVTKGQTNEAPIQTAASAGAAKGDKIKILWQKHLNHSYNTIDAGGGDEQRPSNYANRAHHQMTPVRAPIRIGYPDPAAIAASLTAAHGVLVQPANREGVTTATAHQLKRKEVPNAANVMAQQMQREKAGAATAEKAQNLERKEAPEAAASQPIQKKMPAANASAAQEPQREKAAAMVAAKEQSRGKESKEIRGGQKPLILVLC
jgi:hypothetical protein